MRVFKLIQADCALLGIDPYQSHEIHIINQRSLISFLLHILANVSSGYYFFYVDKPLEQYILSFYVTTSILVCFLQFINLFWQMPKLDEFFVTVGDFVQLRE